MKDTTIRLRSSARTSVGQVRENNEDSVHLWTDHGVLIAMVADGMGGAAAGEEASRIAVEAVRAAFAPLSSRTTGQLVLLTDDWVRQQLRDAVKVGNADIKNRSEASPDMRGMGTTLTLAFVRGDQVTVAHVGDSRAYLIDGYSGHIRQITDDHSFVEALVAAGHLTKEEAENHPMRNVLYRALGQNDDVDIDLYVEPLRSGDRLVLCSDGLTRHVKPAEIAQIALSDDDPDKLTQTLINLANERGGEDNVSVIVIVIDHAPVNNSVLVEPLPPQAPRGGHDIEDTMDLSSTVRQARDLFDSQSDVDTKQNLPPVKSDDDYEGRDTKRGEQ